MGRPLAYWCSGGSLCGRGGISLTFEDSSFLLEVLDAELEAAFAARDYATASSVAQRSQDLTSARIAHRRWVAASGPALLANITDGAT